MKKSLKQVQKQNPSSDPPKAKGLLPALAIAAAILSGLALADYFLDWGLCGTGACDDPRWKTYGQMWGVPVAALGLILYLAIGFLARGRHSILAFLCGLALGGHLYFSWVQARILHTWCLLCLTIAMLAVALCAACLWQTRDRLSRALPAVLGGLLLAMTGGLAAHRGIETPLAPDPLVRLGSPAIYRPEAVTDVPQTPLERMRAARSTGPAEAPVLIEVFTDFECPRCAEFENVVWPQLVKGLGATLSNIRVTYRVFLLEGHPLGWRAAFLCLAAGEREARFVTAMQTLFLRRGEWVGTGNINAVLEQVPGLQGQSERLLDPENTKAAKALIREDVGRGARLGVRLVPTVVISLPESDERRILKDVQPARVYAQVIQEFVQLAQSRPGRKAESAGASPLPPGIPGEKVNQTVQTPVNKGEGEQPQPAPAPPAGSSSNARPGPRDPNHLYVTLEHVGPDRVGTAWLIRRFVDPEARFRFDKPSTKAEGALPFDIPFAEISHQGMHCAFQRALTLYGLEGDEALQKMGRVINDVLPEDTLLDQQREMKLKIHEFRSAAQNDDAKAFELAFPWFDELYLSLGGNPARIGRASGPQPNGASKEEGGAEGQKNKVAEPQDRVKIGGMP